MSGGSDQILHALVRVCALLLYDHRKILPGRSENCFESLKVVQITGSCSHYLKDANSKAVCVEYMTLFPVQWITCNSCYPVDCVLLFEGVNSLLSSNLSFSSNLWFKCWSTDDVEF